MSSLAEVTDSSFDQVVLDATGTTVVDFWAPWCGPCLKLTPHLERFADRLAPAVTIVKLDVDSNPAVAGRLKVRGLPVLAAFKDGEEVARLRGAKSPREVHQWLLSLIGDNESE